MNILEILRIFFGSIFILFVPGFTWSFVFFARKEIDWIERVALSVGLSLALVPVSVFWANWVFHIGVTALNTLIIVTCLVLLALLSPFFRKWVRLVFKSSKSNPDSVR